MLLLLLLRVIMSHRMDTDTNSTATSSKEGTCSTIEPFPKARAIPSLTFPEEFAVALQNLATTQQQQQHILQQLTQKLDNLQFSNSNQATVPGIPHRTTTVVNQLKADPNIPSWASELLASLFNYTEDPSDVNAVGMADTLYI